MATYVKGQPCYGDDDEPNHFGEPLQDASSLVPSGFIDPVLTSTPYHLHQAESALSNIRQLFHDTDGWKKTLRHKSGVVVYMKPGMHEGDREPIFRGVATISRFSPQSVFYVISMRQLWDEYYYDGNLVDNLNETTSLTYEVSRTTTTSRLRDAVLVEKIECAPGGVVMFACTSVQTPRVPRIQGRVRAQIKLQGWILEPIQEKNGIPSTRITYIIQEPVKGWMTKFSSKKSLARRPLIIARVVACLEQKAEQMRLTIPTALQTKKSHSSLGALRSHPSFPERDESLDTCASRGPRSKSSITTLVSSVPSISPTKSTAKKRTTLTDIDLPNISSGTTPDADDPVPDPEQISQPDHTHIGNEAQSILRKRYTQSNAWILQYERDGVCAYLFHHKPQWVRCDMIVTCWTIEQISAVIHCLGARQYWNEPKYVVGRLTQSKDKHHYLSHQTFKTDNETLYDLSVITAIQASPTQIVSATVSVDDPAIPPSSDVIRGRMDMYGWVITCLSDSVKITLITSGIRLQDSTEEPTFGGLITESMATLQGIAQYLKLRGCPPSLRQMSGHILHEQYIGDENNYQLSFIAHHNSPDSDADDQRTCAEVYVHPSAYPDGFDLSISPETGILLEHTSDQVVRLLSRQEMNGKLVCLSIQPPHDIGPAPRYTCNGEPLGQVANSNDSVTTDVTIPSPSTPSSTLYSIGSEVSSSPRSSTFYRHQQPSCSDHPPNRSSSNLLELSIDGRTLHIPNGYILVPEQYCIKRGPTVNIADDLTFNGRQLVFIIFILIVSYYMGRVACLSSS